MGPSRRWRQLPPGENNVATIAPVTVGIPTWARGERVLGTLERVFACDPVPAEVLVHVDAGNGTLERTLASRFPVVRVLSTERRVGPGGGRHRCILAARQPIFASFDDDSWPVDGDFFAETVRLFERHSDAALLAASIIHPWDQVPVRSDASEPAVEFTGCGWAVRRADYRRCPGFVDRPLAYGIEEADLGLQFFARHLNVIRSRNLRVYHDTHLAHHRRPAQTAAAIQNVALLAWLRYPAILCPRASLQIANMVIDQLRRGRWRGIAAGLLGIPMLLWRWRAARGPLSAAAVRGYLARRKRPQFRHRPEILHAPAPASN